MKLTRWPKDRPPMWATERRPFLLVAVPGETPRANQERMFAAHQAYIAGVTFTAEHRNVYENCNCHRES